MNGWLLILLFFCHWLDDYTHLSRPYMLAAKRLGTPLIPIFHHALVHAVLMGITCNLYLGYSLFDLKYDLCDTLFLIQLTSHFVIDVVKGKLNYWYPTLSSPSNPYHWYVFGADQLLHTLIIIFMWALTLNS
jgi:hypothetical protein